MTATKRKSRPARLADDLESAGWTVTRARIGGHREIAGVRDEEVLFVSFERNAQNRDVFERGFLNGGELRSEPEVRKFALAPPDVPFKLNASDADVLAAVAGRTIVWRNSITGQLEEGDVPRGGIHLTIKDADPPGARVLSFPSTTGGWRAVRLDRITKVR